MNMLLLIMAIAFFAGVFIFLACSKLMASFLHSYRTYFITKLGPELKQSFVVADATVLFGLSLTVIGVLGAIGYLAIGFIGMGIGIGCGLLIPSLALKVIKRRRAEQFIYQLPDALHALSSTLRSGVNLPKGLEQLAAWQPPPLSQEFGLVLTEYQIGRELSEALENMQARIGRPELELMSGAILISRSVGGNLADTLEALAETLSEKLSVEGKIQALTAMGRLQGWVVSVVPILMGVALYITNPEQIMPMFTEVRGWITLAVISVMMLMAIIMIRRIVDIDV